jgi:hypothetical protein
MSFVGLFGIRKCDECGAKFAVDPDGVSCIRLVMHVARKHSGSSFCRTFKRKRSELDCSSSEEDDICDGGIEGHNMVDEDLSSREHQVDSEVNANTSYERAFLAPLRTAESMLSEWDALVGHEDDDHSEEDEDCVEGDSDTDLPSDDDDYEGFDSKQERLGALRNTVDSVKKVTEEELARQAEETRVALKTRLDSIAEECGLKKAEQLFFAE